MRILFVSLLVLGCASASADLDARKIDVARRLVELSDFAAVVAGGADVTADAMIASNPTLRPYKAVIMEWFAIAFEDENLVSEMAEIYADSFSETELREIVAFSETPTGQKLLKMQPELMRKGAEVGRRIGEQNAVLLQSMIQERASELERLGQ